MAFELCDLQYWPAGLEKDVAVVKYDPQDLARKVKDLVFTESADEFDYFKGALIKTPSGRTYALVRHKHDPEPGVHIWTKIDSSDISRDIDDVLDSLGITYQDLSWRLEHTSPNSEASD